MNEKYNVYLVSDSTGETLDRIFLSLKSQFANFAYEKKEFAFVRTEQQIDKIIKECTKLDNSLILILYFLGLKWITFEVTFGLGKKQLDETKKLLIILSLKLVIIESLP